MTPVHDPAPVLAVLSGVQRRSGTLRAWAALRQALLGAALGLLLIGGLRLAGLVSVTPERWAIVAALTGLIGAAIHLRQTPALGLLEAARLTDRRLELDSLLATSLGLADSGEEGWEAALHRRVRSRARAAVETANPGQVLPTPQARRWTLPLVLLALAGLSGLLPTLPQAGPAVRPPPAEVLEDLAADPAGAAGPAGEAGVPAGPAGRPGADPPPPGDLAGGSLEAAGRTSDAVTTGSPPSGATTARPASTAAGGDPARLQEARQRVNPGRAGDPAEGVAASAPGSRSTPFGSREAGGQFENQATARPDTLAAAPYDPAMAPGARPVQQKADPGSSGLRAASGGRGIESDGADKCVEGCLTNNDMNRGAPQSPDRPRPPGGETASGTSDSGSGAAGSSSGVGLGVGTLRTLASRSQTEVGAGPSLNADRVRVLVAPDSGSAPEDSGVASTAAWIRAPEPASARPLIPESARATVRAYFKRNSP